MIPLYTPEEFEAAWSRHLLRLECEHCHKEFLKEKHYAQAALKNPKRLRFCSKECKYLNKVKIRHAVICKECGIEVMKKDGEINKHLNKKYKNHFCSQRCSGLYNMKHRTTGATRSKLEMWLEVQLEKIYPKLEIKYNDRSAIQLELDIYIPSLNLAFELNGIFHYEPIYGEENLLNIQRRDKNRYQACIDNNIDLCIIDTSESHYFKPKTSQKFLDIITKIIDERK